MNRMHGAFTVAFDGDADVAEVDLLEKLQVAVPGIHATVEVVDVVKNLDASKTPNCQVGSVSDENRPETDGGKP